MLKIDIHTHIIPKEIPDFSKKFGYEGFVSMANETLKKADMMIFGDGEADADVEIDTVSDGMFSLRDYLIDQTSSLLKNSQGNLNIKKSQAATREIRDRGLLSYSPNFYGFRSAGRSRVTPVADELATVREIFDAYLSGETLAGIARDLNSRGVATFTGKSQWTGAKIRKILTRPQYAGLHPDSSQQLIAAKPFEPHSVVSAEEFHQAQRKL